MCGFLWGEQDAGCMLEMPAAQADPIPDILPWA
jgi:hypothetical protein